MELFKRIVITACVLGILDKIISVLCGDKYTSQMRMITSLVMVIAITSQLELGGITVPDVSYYETELENAQLQAEQDYLHSIEESASKRISQLYSQSGINLKKVSIACSFDEYKYISVDEILLYADDEEKSDEQLISIALEYFPEAQVKVIR